LGDITADASGNAFITFEPKFISASLKANNVRDVIGRGVALHAQMDDCVTQPTGMYHRIPVILQF
jgi:Cu/Zn superoxide dismutase